MNSNESALLSAVLARPTLVDKLEIQDRDIGSSPGRAILAAVRECRDRRIEPDLVAIGDRLRDAGRYDVLPELSALSGVGIPSNAAYHLGRLREAARKRALEAVLRDQLEALSDPARSSRDILEAIETGALEAYRGVPENDRASTEELVPPWLASLDQRARNAAEGKRDGLETGILELDSVVGPIRPGTMNIVAGRPGSGKTALVLGVVAHSAIDAGVPTTLFTLEMSREEVLDRLASMRSGVPLGKIRAGFLSGSDSSRILATSKQLTAAPLAIYDGPHGLGVLRSRIRAQVARGCRLVVVDYLGLLDLGGAGKVPRWERVSEASRAIKLLALDLRVSIVCAVQLGREAEGKRPTMADLRDSGSIEQDADLIVLLHATDPSESVVPRPVDAIVAKNRNGPTGRATMNFWGATIHFSTNRGD